MTFVFRMFVGIVALASMGITPAFATTNPCGNHGNHCCTSDGGESYDSTEVTCDAYAKAVCGDCKNLSIYEAVQNTKVACQATQENSNAAASYCGSAEQTCGDLTANLSCPACPDLQAACAQWIYRYTKKGALKSQRCKRWVVPVAFPSN